MSTYNRNRIKKLRYDKTPQEEIYINIEHGPLSFYFRGAKGNTGNFVMSGTSGDSVNKNIIESGNDNHIESTQRINENRNGVLPHRRYFLSVTVNADGTYEIEKTRSRVYHWWDRRA